MSPYPTVEYWLGYIADTEGNTDLAREWFKKAESKDIDYVFPFRLETVKALDKALEYMTNSANTWYYLGNLYYHKQPEKVRFYKLEDGTFLIEIPEMTELEQNIDVMEMFK